MRPQWTIGDRLAKARAVAGISRGQMARELEVDPATITRWEHGRSAVERRTLIAYASVCSVELDWLESDDNALVDSVTAGYPSRGLVTRAALAA